MANPETISNQQVGAMNVTIIPTTKFKTTKIVFKFRAPLDRATVTKRSLLAVLFETNNAAYPTQTAFRRKLAELYGASFYTSASKKGDEHIISAVFDFVDPQYLMEKTDLLREVVHFLRTIFFDPNVRDNQFEKATFEREKENLKSQLESIYDDKITYAAKRTIEEMYQSEGYQYSANGIIEDLDNLTAAETYDYYQTDFLKNDVIDVFVCGDIDSSVLLDHLQLLPFAERPNRAFHSVPKVAPGKVHTIHETQAINQGKLVLGYQTGILFGDEKFVPLQIANGLLGGFANSKIFINVREKASLAYYASSRIDSFKGYLLIQAGIEETNYEQAVAIIKEQVTAMKQGDFTDEDIEQTKQLLVNQMLEASDQAGGLVELTYNNIVKPSDLAISEWISKIKAVTKAEIIAAMADVLPNTIYFLSKGGEA